MSRSCSAALIRRSADRRGLFCALRAALVSAISRSRMGVSPLLHEPSSYAGRRRSARKPALTAHERSRLVSVATAQIQRDDRMPTTPKPWTEAPLTGRLVLADGTRHRRPGPRRHRLGRRRGVLQHGHDRLPGDPHRSLLRRPDHHLHLPPHRQRRHQPRGHRDLQPRHALGRARLRAARRRHRALQLPRRRAPRSVAEGARHHRASPASTRARSPRASASRACPTASSRTSRRPSSTSTS